MIKGLIKKIFSFAFRHPIASLVILLILAVGGLFLTYEAMHITSNPNFCRKCHPKTIDYVLKDKDRVLGEYATWSLSLHAAYDVECLDCHTIRPGIMGYMHSKVFTGLHDLVYEFLLSEEEKIANLTELQKPENAAHLVPEQVCLHCHSDLVNATNRDEYAMSAFGVKMRALDTVVNPAYRQMNNMIDILNEPVRAGAEPQHLTHYEAGVDCAFCHTPKSGSLAHSGPFRGAPSMSTCWDCHDQQREAGNTTPPANDDCTTCHVTQVAMQNGTAAQSYGVKVTEWVMSSLTCDMCHSIEANTVSRPTRETCVNCHDESYADMFYTLQEEFNANASYASYWPIHEVFNREYMTPTRREAFDDFSELLYLMQKDGSRSIHNNVYTADIFNRMKELGHIQ